MLSEEHEELKLKIESINDTNHASTSCFDKPNPCNEKFFEDVVVESCDDLIAKENDELKQEIERLMTDLRWLKGKYTQEHAQPSQDNPLKGMNKLEKGETMTCFKFHKEGHKSYQCKEKKGEAKGKENGKPKN